MPRRFQNLELLDGKPRKLRRLRHEICSNLSQQIEMVNLFIPLKMSPVRPRLATQTRGGQKSNIQTGAVDLCRSIGLIKIDHLRRKVASGSRSVLGNGMAANRPFSPSSRRNHRSLPPITAASTIHNGLLFYHYELNRYHVLNTDYIMPFEHLFETCRPKGCKKGEQWSLSTLDLLIIGMGMELTRMTGGDTYIVTCDRRIDKVARVLADLNRDHRSQHEIPNYIRFPRTLYLWETSLQDLPRVDGQRVG